VIRTTDTESDLDLVFFEETKVPKFEPDNDNLPGTGPILHAMGVYKIFKVQDGFSAGHKVAYSSYDFVIDDTTLEVGACYFVSRWNGNITKVDLPEFNRMIEKLDAWHADATSKFNNDDELAKLTNRNFEAEHFKEFTVAELDNMIAERESAAATRLAERIEERNQAAVLRAAADTGFKKTGRIIHANGKSVANNVADFGVRGCRAMRIEIPTELKFSDYFGDEIMERIDNGLWANISISLINLDIPFEVITTNVNADGSPTPSTGSGSAVGNIVDRFTVKPSKYGTTTIDGVKVKSRRYEYILEKRIKGIKGSELEMYEKFSGVKSDVIGLNKMIVPYNRSGTPIELTLPISVRARDKYADSLEVTLGTQEIKAKIRYTDFREIVCKGLTLKEKMEPHEVLHMYERLEIDKPICMEEFKRLYSLASLGKN